MTISFYQKQHVSQNSWFSSYHEPQAKLVEQLPHSLQIKLNQQPRWITVICDERKRAAQFIRHSNLDLSKTQLVTCQNAEHACTMIEQLASCGHRSAVIYLGEQPLDLPAPHHFALYQIQKTNWLH
ncbi:hypothetical protein VST7929_00974 [Vibrio stylophorae]|uniref:Uncharacterized protein n=1 Tax=Vibrio stylophorae TaxID=659351 RepID=A0ABM8ZS54_9VIBR|nr:hypothetical protein [Vibrio stylophorae]CAH0533121.1 hypothetical protein VST7929_00974 [Vibrio stylophorae]